MKDREAIVDRIYECSLLPELWCDVLDDLSDLAGARGGLLFAANSQILNWTASESIRGGAIQFVQSGLFSRTRRLPGLLKADHAGFLRDVDMLADEEMAADPTYRDILWPLGLGSAAGTLIKFPTGDLLILSLEAERARGPIEPRIVAMLDSLRPHIARSTLLSARLQLERARIASETLALLGLPALVFDNAGRVLAANALSASLGDHIRWRARDRVSLKDGAADVLLQHALSALDGEVTDAVRSFAIRRTEDRPGMIVHVIPIRGTARDLFARAAAILVLTPVTMPQAPAVDLVQSLFDLTPAEARVASSLVAGDTPDQIAAKGQVSLNTVRSQVRGVLDKTGCRRQTEFVALVSRTSI